MGGAGLSAVPKSWGSPNHKIPQLWHSFYLDHLCITPGGLGGHEETTWRGSSCGPYRSFVSWSATSVDVWLANAEALLPRACPTPWAYTSTSSGKEVITIFRIFLQNIAEVPETFLFSCALSFSDAYEIRKYLVLKQIKIGIQCLFVSPKSMEYLIF